MKRTPSGVHVSVGIMQFQCKWTDEPEFGGTLSLKTFSVSAGRTFTPMRTVVSVLFKVSARCLPRAGLSRGIRAFSTKRSIKEAEEDLLWQHDPHHRRHQMHRAILSRSSLSRRCSESSGLSPASTTPW